MKRIFLSLLALCALFGFRSSTLAAERARNILFILVDDQRWDSMSCMGDPFPKSMINQRNP